MFSLTHNCVFVCLASALIMFTLQVDGFLTARTASPAGSRLHSPSLSVSSRPVKRNNKKKGQTNKRKRTSFKPSSRREPQPRVVLTNYDVNRSPHVNEERLMEGTISCPHFDTCPGCIVEDQISKISVIQSAKLFFSSTGVRKRRLDVSGDSVVTEADDDGFFQVVVPSSLTGWRTQAKLAVAPRSSSWGKDGCSFGLFARGTHTVVEIPDCQVHHPSINQAVEALVKSTAKMNIASANAESREDGGLRYVQFQVERSTGKICLTLVWDAENMKETQPALTRLTKDLQRSEPDLWHSIWCHCNDTPGNAIFSRSPNRWHRMIGPEFVREPLPVGNMGWLYFSPLAFRQGNMDGFDILARDVATSIPGNSRVCELYAGIGLLGLTALSHHAMEGTDLQWIRCSDENPANPRCFERSVNSLPGTVTGRGGKRNQYNVGGDDNDELTIAEMMQAMQDSPGAAEETVKKTSYMVATAKNALYKGQALGADVLVVDPPRKGLEVEVIDELCKKIDPKQPYAETKDMLELQGVQRINWVNDVRTLIYVSCGWDALARDCEQLLRNGWMLESATGYILFPGSDHVETLAIFQRV